jgi:hypothetical protein
MSKKIIICLEDSHLGQQRQLLDALLRQVMSSPYMGVASSIVLEDSGADEHLWARLVARAREQRQVPEEGPQRPPDPLVDALDRQLAQAKFLRGSVSVLVARPSDQSGNTVTPDTGDEPTGGLLEEAARSAMRQSDELHWWGPTRLCLVLPNCPGREAMTVGNRMAAEVERRGPYRVTFGAASYPYDALHPGTLLRIAQDRMERDAPGPEVKAPLRV